MRWLLALIVQFASFAAVAQDTVHFPSFDAGGGNPETELTVRSYSAVLFSLGKRHGRPASAGLLGTAHCATLIRRN